MRAIGRLHAHAIGRTGLRSIGDGAANDARLRLIDSPLGKPVRCR